MESIYKDTIGVGATYPIELTPNDKGEIGWYPVSSDKLIENNLCSVLNYNIGQRFREEDFGTRLWECLEEPNSQALAFLIDRFLRDCISTWEPRITYKSSTITRDGSKLHIHIIYVINYTNSSKSATVTYNLN